MNKNKSQSICLNPRVIPIRQNVTNFPSRHLPNMILAGRSSWMLCKCEVKGESEKSLKYENAICGDMQKDQQPLNTRISEDISKSFAYLHFCFFTCPRASILLYAPATKGILSSPRVWCLNLAAEKSVKEERLNSMNNVQGMVKATRFPFQWNYKETKRTNMLVILGR